MFWDWFHFNLLLTLFWCDWSYCVVGGVIYLHMDVWIDLLFVLRRRVLVALCLLRLVFLVRILWRFLVLDYWIRIYSVVLLYALYIARGCFLIYNPVFLLLVFRLYNVLLLDGQYACVVFLLWVATFFFESEIDIDIDIVYVCFLISIFIGIYLLCREPGGGRLGIRVWTDIYLFEFDFGVTMECPTPHPTLPARPAPKFSLYPLSKYINIFVENLYNA